MEYNPKNRRVIAERVSQYLKMRYLFEYSQGHTDVSFYEMSQSWYMAKMLKYLMPDVTIMEYTSNELGIQYFVKVTDLVQGVEKTGYLSTEEISDKELVAAKEVPVSEYDQADYAAWASSYGMNFDNICIKLTEYILSDPYYKEILGEARGDVSFDGVRTQGSRKLDKRGNPGE